jgi:glycosyltransferase involved in cell wall biosynthesis
MTDPLGQSQVLPYLSGLSKRGYSITLLSCEKPARYEQYKNIIAQICAAANINWQPIPYTASPPVVSTIKDIMRLHKEAYHLHAEKKFDIVHCRSYISAMVGQTMKKKFGTRFLFDMRGFWADERVDGGLWKRSNPLFNTIYKYFKKKEIQYLQEADHTISLTNAGKDEIHSWQHINGQPVPTTVIPCCVDTELFKDDIDIDRKAALRRALNIGEAQPVVGYVGSIGTWYMLDEMLLAYKAFKQQLPDCVMLFITTEPEAMVMDAAKQLDIDTNNIIVRAAAREEVPRYISIMNYSVFFIKPCFSKKASSPTKQGEIMAMGVPVLCNTGVGDTAHVVDTYHSGVAVESFDEAALNKAISQVLHTNYNKADIRRGALEFYGLAKGIDTYESVYRKLLTR